MSNKAYETLGVVATIDPDANAAGALTSDWANAENWVDGFMAICMVGTLGTSATVDFKLQQATDSSGTGAKDISGKSITQLTDAGSDSDKQAIVFVRPDELDVAGGFTHVAMVLTTATATSDSGAVMLGCGPRHTPASEFDLASVDEIVD